MVTKEKWFALRKRALRRGTTLIEFALIFTMLLGLTLGTVQYGIILNKVISLSHVSREGGRYAAVNALTPNIDANIKQYIVDVGKLKGVAIEPSKITFKPPQNTDSTSTNRRQYQPLEVKITYEMKPHMFLPATFFGIPIYNGTRVEETQMVME